MSCGKEKEFACDQCDLTTKLSSYLKRHKENVHYGIVYPCSDCEYCEYKAKHKHDLDNHFTTRHDDITMDCEKCSYKAQSKISLTKHMEYRHQGIFHQCDICSQKYASISSLNTHKRDSHIQKTLQCKMCDFKGGHQAVQKHKNVVHKKIRFYVTNAIMRESFQLMSGFTKKSTI